MFDRAPAPAPFSVSHPAPVRPLQQSPEFAGALRHCRQTPLILDRLDRTLVLKRRFRAGLQVAMLPRVAIRKPLRLLEILQEEGLRRTPVLISPDHPVPELGKLGAIPLFSPAHVAILDLQRDGKDMRAGLDQKWRNRLVHAESSGLRVTRQNLTQDPNHWLFAADATQQKLRGYRNWPRQLTLAYAHENPGRTQVFTAWQGQEPVAAILLLLHGAGATYHIGHTTQKGRETSAHNLLFWNAIEWLNTNGTRQLDLGVINTEDAPGLARFKLGLGARLQPLGGTWIWWPPLGAGLRFLSAFDQRLMTPRKTGQDVA